LICNAERIAGLHRCLGHGPEVVIGDELALIHDVVVTVEPIPRCDAKAMGIPSLGYSGDLVLSRFGSVASRRDQFRCAQLGRLEEDANGEIDRAAVREQPDRLVQVDV
jgi:hypothetical protein